MMAVLAKKVLAPYVVGHDLVVVGVAGDPAKRHHDDVDGLVAARVLAAERLDLVAQGVRVRSILYQRIIFILAGHKAVFQRKKGLSAPVSAHILQ